MKVLIQAPLTVFSGYGNDGIGIVRAFLRRGADVYIEPTGAQPPLPQEVAELFLKPNVGPFDLIIEHVDPSALHSKEEVKRSAGVYIGWTMWEYSNLLNNEEEANLRENYAHYDALIGYDDVSVEALRPYFDGPILKQQGGFWPEDWPEVERDWNEENFYFAMIGVLSERKDPFVAIQAFSELKQEDSEFDKYARLSLKTSVPGLHSAMENVYPGLRIFYDAWPVEVVREFYKAQHVLLAPSRGEGKNMPALEFMSTGGTVIATDWAGHREWLGEGWSYALDFELQPVSTDFPDTFNARASVPHLKELMLHAFRNRDEVRRKGQLAASIIPGMCSWDAVIERLLLKLRTHLPEGERLWMSDHVPGGFHG